MLAQDERYESPSTPGLRINFRAYAVELICLNMNPGLGPRFWRSGYWSEKFRREMAGLKQFVTKYHKGPELELSFQQAVLAGIQMSKCQSLLSKVHRVQLWQTMETLKQNGASSTGFDAEKNASIVELQPGGIKQTIRQIEAGTDGQTQDR